jgi:hypothetical protein
MNTLESLKERLKRKPIVQHNPSVKVVIDGKVPEKQSTVIVVEKDDGNRALQILEKIKLRNKDLHQYSIETAKMFYDDGRKNKLNI